MKLTPVQIERMVRRIIDELKKNNAIHFKSAEEAAVKRAIDLIKAEYEKEKSIEAEARAMVDKLEQQSSEDFSRHKMTAMIKQKLAKEKGVVL